MIDWRSRQSQLRAAKKSSGSEHRIVCQPDPPKDVLLAKRLKIHAGGLFAHKDKPVVVVRVAESLSRLVHQRESSDRFLVEV